MMRKRNIAAGVGAAVLLTLPLGQVARAEVPQRGTTMQHTADDSSGKSADREERERRDQPNERSYDSGEYRGDDKSSRNSDERIVDVDLLNTSPDKKNGKEDDK